MVHAVLLSKGNNYNNINYRESQHTLSHGVLLYVLTLVDDVCFLSFMKISWKKKKEDVAESTP